MPVLKSSFKYLLALLALVPTGVWADDSGIYHYPLKNLQSSGRMALSQLSNEAKVVVVFQPECDWCEKQINDLAQIAHQCSGLLSPVLIGSLGERRQLKRELQRFDQGLPALQADSRFIRRLGGVVATPVTLFFDRKGRLLAKKRGYMDKQKLKQAINIQTQSQCAA